MSCIERTKFLLWSRPVFRTCEIIANHAARIFENGRSLANARAELDELNQKRMRYQRVLNRIGASHSHVCMECKGKCCGGARERDAFTDRVLQHPDTPHRLGRRKTGNMAAYDVAPERVTSTVAHVEGECVPGFCPELTTRGCRIPYELRPIQCTAYFCNATINELSPKECRTGSKALIGLMKVQIAAALLALKSRGRKS
ncbi:MAG: hypothetical protein ABFD49_06760 [Armatimonadota bacterium]|nr:hypothetical protein [bacterium]